MPKLSEKQRRELREDIDQNELTKEELMDKFGISLRQLRRYLGDKNRTVGKPPKEVEVIEPVEELEEDEIDEDESEDQEIEMQQDFKESEDPMALDPNKDYCSECYRQGRKTELLKGSERCVVCGVELEW